MSCPGAPGRQLCEWTAESREGDGKLQAHSEALNKGASASPARFLPLESPQTGICLVTPQKLYLPVQTFSVRTMQ